MCVCFVSETPTSERGVIIQAVILTDIKVRRSKEGNLLVSGRDAAIEAERDLVAYGRTCESFNRKRAKEDKRWRQFRLDRIVRGTIHGFPDTRKMGVRG